MNKYILKLKRLEPILTPKLLRLGLLSGAEDVIASFLSTAYDNMIFNEALPYDKKSVLMEAFRNSSWIDKSRILDIIVKKDDIMLKCCNPIISENEDGTIISLGMQDDRNTCREIFISREHIGLFQEGDGNDLYFYVPFSQVKTLYPLGIDPIKVYTGVKCQDETFLDLLFEIIKGTKDKDISLDDKYSVKCINAKKTTLELNKSYLIEDVKGELIEIDEGTRKRFYNLKRFKIQ
jgi:hypothetical protein